MLRGRYWIGWMLVGWLTVAGVVLVAILLVGIFTETTLLTLGTSAP